jgi:hypothetical protein
LRARVHVRVRADFSLDPDEFRLYRDQLRTDLTRHNVEVKVQEDFNNLGGDMLDKLDVYIAHCDAVVHLVGDMTGVNSRALGLDWLQAVGLRSRSAAADCISGARCCGRKHL